MLITEYRFWFSRYNIESEKKEPAFYLRIKINRKFMK